MRALPIAIGLLVSGYGFFSTLPAIAQTKPAPPKSATAPDRWEQTVGKSELDDSPTVVLRLPADAPVRVWLKSVIPTLILRCKERALDTYIVTNTAADVEKGDSRSVRLRFNSNAPERGSWLKSTDNDGLFAPEPEVLLDRLRSTTRLLFEFTPFNAPPVVVSFSTAGLSNHLARLMAACPESTLTQAQKLERRRQTNPMSQDLVGWTEAQVKQRLGEPHFIAGQRWTFDAESKPLSVYFRDGKVNEVSPDNVPLSTVPRRSEPPEAFARSTTPPAPGPTGAVARCGDGTFIFVSTGDDTCKDNGNVSEWFDGAVPPSPAPSPPVASTRQTEVTETPKRPATELIGKRQAEVTRVLSTPSLISNGTWFYDTPKGSLRVVFTDDEVTVVQPDNFDLATITERPALVALPPTPPKRPTGAVAQCGDGLYVFVARSNSCDGHGGVKERFLK